MKTVDEHLAGILATVGPLGVLDLPLGEAHGCVLGADAVAAVALPGFDNSSMDGYAVRTGDLAADGGRLTVIGDIAAGTPPPYTIEPGLTARIMTGAVLPRGADAVVPQEWTDQGHPVVTVHRRPDPGAFIRRAGEDLAAGELVLAAGTHLGAAQIGLLAAAGHPRVRVHPRPRVVVLSTGSELRDPGEPLGPGQLWDSNSHALAAAVREAGALAYRIGAVPDDASVLERTLEDHLVRADAVVTSGGVSVGAYDVVKEVLSRSGRVAFDKVAMQPGMPQGFGVIGAEDIPVFGLPGNPVSALVSFEIFVRPALRRMLGAEPLLRPALTARWAGPQWSSPAGKRQFVRASLARAAGGGYELRAIGGAGSHLLSGMAAASALAVIGEEVTVVEPGDEVTAMLMERRGR